eukprot:5213090-Heterocapsa_arctica.AAC.1
MVVYLPETFDIVVLQEVHGNSADTIELQQILPGYSIHTSYADNTAEGGVAIIMSPSILTRYPIMHPSDAIEPGRVIKVE